jgi:hypothetical protein
MEGSYLVIYTDTGLLILLYERLYTDIGGNAHKGGL